MKRKSHRGIEIYPTEPAAPLDPKPERNEFIVVLRDDGMSWPEIARQFNISTGTAYRAYHRTKEAN